MATCFSLEDGPEYSLADRLAGYSGDLNVLVLSLPAGGVAITYALALTLDLPFDVIDARPLMVPGREGIAFGVVATGGFQMIDEDVVETYGISEKAVKDISGRMRRKLEQHDSFFRRRTFPSIREKIVVLVDDGMSAGTTRWAAVAALRGLGAARVILASPTSALVIVDAHADGPTNSYAQAGLDNGLPHREVSSGVMARSSGGVEVVVSTPSDPGESDWISDHAGRSMRGSHIHARTSRTAHGRLRPFFGRLLGGRRFGAVAA